MGAPEKRSLREILAHNVRRMRLKRGLSQVELADFAASTQRRISNLESAKVAVTIDTVEKLAEALQTTPEVLVRPSKSA